MKTRILALLFLISPTSWAAPVADAAQEALPAEWRYDKAPTAKEALRVVYPFAALRDGVEGKAKALVMIDEKGHVTGVTAGEATTPEFAGALAAGLEALEFLPAKRAGKATATAVVYEHVFSSKVMPPDLKALLAREKQEPATVRSAADVDGGLKPKFQARPVFPVGLAGQNLTGEAVIEILINEKGRVRLPRVVSASDPAFGYAATQAVTKWVFNPPLVKGKPAVVRLRVPFRFGMEAVAAKS